MLNAQALQPKLERIFKDASANALDESMKPTSHKQSVSEINTVMGYKFGKGFGSVMSDLASELTTSVSMGLVSTSNGVAPPLPAIFVGSDFKRICENDLSKVFSTALNTPVPINNPKIMNYFTTNLIKAIPIFTKPFCDSIAKTLSSSGFSSVNSILVFGELNKHFEKYFKLAFDEFEKKEITEREYEKIIKNNIYIFSNSFKKISKDFADSFIKILKSGAVTIPLGTGKIS